MEIGWFDRIVRVNLGQGGKLRSVANTVEAAECLVYQWPSAHGRQWRRARTTCMAVLRGEKPPRYAEHAFVEAAREAHILRGLLHGGDRKQRREETA